MSCTVSRGQESPPWKMCEKHGKVTQLATMSANQLLHQQKFSPLLSLVRSHIAACLLKACCAHKRFTHMKWFLLRAKGRNYRDCSLRSFHLYILPPPSQKTIIRGIENSFNCSRKIKMAKFFTVSPPKLQDLLKTHTLIEIQWKLIFSCIHSTIIS